MDNLHPDPIVSFGSWFEEARARADILLPDAACLSTIDLQGYPDGRMVLVKRFDDRGFVFFTNLESVKSESLRKNPRASLTFHWEKLGRQVRIQGDTETVSDAEADAYFATRPRDSQIGAWASRQSGPLESRSVLENRFREFEEKFAGQEVPRPPFWSGFRIIPLKIEFWEERPNRLHDRVVYKKLKDRWENQLLYP